MIVSLYSSSIEKYKVVYFILFIRMKDQMDQTFKCKIKSSILGKTQVNSFIDLKSKGPSKYYINDVRS